MGRMSEKAFESDPCNYCGEKLNGCYCAEYENHCSILPKSTVRNQPERLSGNAGKRYDRVRNALTMLSHVVWVMQSELEQLNEEYKWN